MDYQSPPEIVIAIPAEHHNVAEEVVEHVARLIARAEGVDPDHDDRCGTPTGGSSYVTCDLSMIAKPAWARYRERAETMLRNLFPVPVSQPDPCAPLSIYPMHCINPAVR
jgi:hypothetical protein